MNSQQDKSKGSILQYSICNAHISELSSSHSHYETPLPSPSFFDKFKQPEYEVSSAFRLCQPLSHNSRFSAAKKAALIRKHRGNYRKYTVAEKEQAVKQVNIAIMQILQGVDAKEISEKYGIPRRNLLRWKKNGCERKEGGGRPTDGEMEITLYTKIDNKTLLNEKEIRAEAKRLSKMADFKASKGWYCKFSRRYNQWKKQERQRCIHSSGSAEGLQKDMFLLPEVSEDSEYQSSSENGQLQANLDQ